MSLTSTPAWDALSHHASAMRRMHLRDLFAGDPGRAERYSVTLDGLLIDFSKQLIVDDTLRLLFDLARDRDVSGRIEAMFRGDPINVTENRPVLHVALRNLTETPITVAGSDVMPAVRTVREKMLRFAESVRDGSWRGHTGCEIRDVVNIGIGGSDLGPRMVTEALGRFAHPRIRSHFVSNVDATDIARVLARVDREKTLFIVASKSFTTQETMTNARTARSWFLEEATEEAIKHHFVAVSTNERGVEEFGIDPQNMFEFWDWVGGRFSLWSAIGLPIACAIGSDHFRELLAGAQAVDDHFRSAPPENNACILLGLVGIWNSDFLGHPTHAVLPYDQYLARFPAFLQQLDMESNGKRTTLDGETVRWSTGPVVWGEPGTNGQHAFFQLMHQGTQTVPADFLAPVHPSHDIGDHHAILLANFLAQTEALMRGRTAEEVRQEMEREGVDGATIARLLPHRVFPGNKPTTTILYERLDPRHLGMLIALYEHVVFVQGAIWGINSFDQWGVELGKVLARRVLADLESDKDVEGHDASTSRLIAHCRRGRRDQPNRN